MHTHESDPARQEPAVRDSGIDVVGDLPWGSHICNFYESKDDLLDILVPYFKAGLENNEYCLWIASQVTVEEARTALEKAVPRLNWYLDKKCIEIIPYGEWYLEGGEFNGKAVMQGWLEKLNIALAAGFDGMRVHGNESWLDREVWKDFIEYERELNQIMQDRRMITLCTYPLSKTDAGCMMDVAHVHECAMTRRKGKWEILEMPPENLTKAQRLREQKRLEKMVAERTALIAIANENLLREAASHQQTLQTLAKAEQNYREIFDKASDGILIIAIKSGEIIDCNIKACEILGLSKVELTSGGPAHISSLNIGYTREEAGIKIKEVLKHGDQSFEWQVRFKDGSVHWIEASLTTADIAGKKVILAFFHVVDARKMAEQQLEEERQLKQIAITDAVITAAENERQVIGRELHDNIQQILSSAKLYLGMARKAAFDKHALIEEADQLLKTAIIELRNLSHSMISPFIEEYGLSDALERLVDTLAAGSSIRIEKQISKFDENKIPDKLKLAIYRIAQEQFSNIIKYAKASKVVLKLVAHNETILLKIKDDGVGFNMAAKNTGIGLINMRTRASLFRRNHEPGIISRPGLRIKDNIQLSLPFIGNREYWLTVCVAV